MDYTQSDANVTHAGTGHRMHQDAAPVTTAVSADDMNQLIWSLMAVLEDQGVTATGFDPSQPMTYQGLLTALKKMTTRQTSGMKAWRRPTSIRDKAVVVSLTLNDGSEPLTEVLGLVGPEGLAQYPDRDGVVLNLQAFAPPPTLVTANTTFTATSVTSADFGPLIAAKKIDVGTLLDTAEASRKSAIVTAVDAANNRLTVDVGWWVVNSSPAVTAIPAAGTAVVVDPLTKVWGENTNLGISATAHALSGTGYEMGFLITKSAAVAQASTGFDTVTLQGYAPGSHYRARGEKIVAWLDTGGSMYTVQSMAPSEVGMLVEQDGTLSGTRSAFYSRRKSGATSGAKEAYVSEADKKAFVARDPDTFGFAHEVAGSMRFRTDKDGNIAGSYFAFKNLAGNTTIYDDFWLGLITAAGTTTLPNANSCTGKLYRFVNKSGGSVTIAGGVSTIDGAATLALASGAVRELFSDGYQWRVVL